MLDAAEYKEYKKAVEQMYTDKNIPQLENHLRERSGQYYNGDTETIPDWQYEVMVDRLKELYPISKFFLEVGSRPSTDSRIKHSVKMLSLEKLDGMSGATEWFNLKEKDGISEYKYDGVAVDLIYNSGTLYRAVTRGDGSFGEDITRHAREISSIPQEIAILKRYGETHVRGELVLSKARFLEKFKLRGYRNPRNTVAGLLNRLDTSDSSDVDFKAYSLLSSLNHTTQAEIRRTLAVMGFDVVEGVEIFSIDNLREAYELAAKNRDMLPYDIDGIVVKLNSLSWQRKIGDTNHHPRWAFCLKFEAKGAKTKLLDIVPQVGRTGRITPVAIVEPVDIDGITIQRMSVHNYHLVHIAGLRKGDEVYVVRAKDVIPQIVQNLSLENRPAGDRTSEFKPPAVCPECGEKTKDVGEYLVCPSNSCPAKAAMYLNHYVKIHRIMGIGPEVINGLIESGWVSDPVDLYKLTPPIIEQINIGAGVIGWKRADSICSEIRKSKVQPIDKFIQGLNIPLVGEDVSRKIAILICKSAWTVQYESLIDRLLAIVATPSRYLSNTDGIGSKIIDNISSANELVADRIREFSSIIEVKILEEAAPDSNTLTGLVFSVTGTLSIKRDEFKQLVETKGGKFNKAPVKGTSVLVVGTDPGDAKLTQANKNGVPIIDENQFIDCVSDRAMITKYLGV